MLTRTRRGRGETKSKLGAGRSRTVRDGHSELVASELRPEGQGSVENTVKSWMSSALGRGTMGAKAWGGGAGEGQPGEEWPRWGPDHSGPGQPGFNLICHDWRILNR